VSLKDKEKWDSKYATDEYVTGTEPCDWLKDNAGFLTGKGQALDIAMGEGRNAVFVAGLGYEVLGVDVSEAGVRKAQALARGKNVKIETLAVDLDGYRLPEKAYDLILCFNFLDRRMFPEIRRALLPDGLVFFETFTIDHLKHSSFKREWVLEYNELLREFSEFRVLKYQEIDRNGKAMASIVAQKDKK
jgi:SAM-dependent methyltransferase